MRALTSDTASITKLEDLGLEDQGYEPGTPIHASDDFCRVDVEVCRQAHCGHCGIQGLECHPYSKPGSYRTVAVCGRCGHAQEF